MSVDFGRMQEVFLAAVEHHAPGQWDAYLDEACAGDEELRGQVAMLLKAHAQEGSLPGRAALGLGRTEAYQPLSESPGTVIGPYKLLEQIGEGGFGIVFMAEQQQPVRRKVALKVLKPGMDTRQVVARFEAERQALALMDHPHIAKVLDGGETATGRPFFVMDLVKGVPITQYCDQNQLTARERLELFVQVCQAVQHAHQKGIIHRDVKPSNVLVSRHDGTPVVKVIDFGIAKALGQRLTDKTLFTEFGAVVGTLEYMSPEQAELNNQDIDTRSDIYSLGVLLYELLTGTTPLDRKRLQQAALLEVLRLIREEEPPRPSTRLSESKETLPSISAQRQTEPAKLTRLVRGELDWIVMKALEKDRSRRYDSANGFAADMQRYLADEPVLACPPSAWYRLRKFARRNRAALTTLVLVAAALLTAVVALVISNVSITWEKEEKSKALQEKSEALVAKDAALTDATASRQQAEANLTLILAALDEVYVTEAEKRLAAYRNEPHKPEVSQDPRRAQVERDFLQKGMTFYERLIQPGRAEPAARFQTGKAYRRVGILQSELKQYDKAAEALEKAGSLLDELAKESLTEPQYRWELAQAYRWQGQVWPNRKVPQRAEAAQAFRRAAALAEELAAESLSNPDYRMHAATCRVSAGGVLAGMKRTPEAEAEYLKGLKLWQQLVAGFPKERWYRHELAYNLDSLGWLWEGVNEPEKAEPFFRQALAYHKKLVAEDATIDDSPERLARTHQHLAQVLTKMGRLPEAKKARREALAVLEKLDPKDAGAWYGRGLAYFNLDEYDKAIADLNKAIKLDPKSAPAHNALGAALGRQGKRDEALAEYRKATELDPEYAPAHSNLGGILSEQGKLDEAIAECRKAIALDPNYVPAHSNLGVALRDQGKLDEAVAECRKAIALDPKYAKAHCGLGNALDDQGKRDEAVAEYRQAIALDPEYAPTHNNLGAALWKQGKLDEAVAELRKAADLDPKSAPAHSNLGVALLDQGKLVEAVAECRQAIALDPNNALAHSNLGNALAQQGKLDEAVTECRKAIELKPDYAGAHVNLGNALALQGKWDEAIACYRRAIALDPKDALAHSHLGVALQERGKLDEAIAEYRKAIELQPERADAHCGLGLALQQQGEFRQALEELRRGHELGSKNPNWRLPSAQWVRQCERLVELDGKLTGFLDGKATPASAAERIELAGLCCLKHRNGAAARFYEEAFAEQPKLAENLQAFHRYNAAGAAALAGCGQGKDVAGLDDKERARLRRLALDWLRADLEARRGQLKSWWLGAAGQARQAVRHALEAPDFAGVRGPEALARLPEAERQSWHRLWDDAADMLARAQSKTTPEKKPDAK
jgi:tetratricopeptide (TPR) repeat protein